VLVRSNPRGPADRRVVNGLPRENTQVLDESLVGYMNVALNESEWLDCAVEAPTRQGRFTFRVLTLALDGEEPADRVVSLVLGGVTRVAASLRLGRWDDEQARVEPFTLDELSAVVRSFNGLPIYGWEFIDPPEESWSTWSTRLSLDQRWNPSDSSHVLDVFQAGGPGPERHLDLRIWFGDLSVSARDGAPITLDEFAAGGVRWWDALYAGDPATWGHGIVPARAPSESRVTRQSRGLRAFINRVRHH
jgi:hypothetical protein